MKIEVYAPRLGLKQIELADEIDGEAPNVTSLKATLESEFDINLDGSIPSLNGEALLGSHLLSEGEQIVFTHRVKAGY
jgi:hypothetical protein